MDAFASIFGGSNTMRVIGYLIDITIDISISDIMDGTNLTRKTVEKILASLVNKEIILVTRKIGKTQMYKLNRENIIVKNFLSINRHVIKKQEAMLVTA